MVVSSVSNTSIQMVYCIGITGTIASGKSTAAHYFKTHGITVLSADAYAKSLVAPGEPAFLEIKQYFGESILTETGELNRQKIRQRILTDNPAKAWLEACLHPRIRECIAAAVKTIQTPYCVIEIPLLTHRADYPYLNRVLLIEAPLDTQIDRLMKRDHCTQKEASDFLKAQSHQALQREIADDILVNDNTLLLFEEQLAKIHQKYINASRYEEVKGIKK